MDPYTTLELIFDGDADDAFDAAENLREWVLDDGYLPMPTNTQHPLNDALGRVDRYDVLTILTNIVNEG